MKTNASVRRQLKIILSNSILGVQVSKSDPYDRNSFIAQLSLDDSVVSSLHDLMTSLNEACPPEHNSYKKDPALGDIWYVVHHWDKMDEAKKAAFQGFLTTIVSSKAFQHQTSARMNKTNLFRKFKIKTNPPPFKEPKPMRGGYSYLTQPIPSDTTTRHERQKAGDALIPSNLSREQGKGELESSAHPDAFMSNDSLPIEIDIQDAMTDISNAEPTPEMKYSTKMKGHKAETDMRLMKKQPMQHTSGYRPKGAPLPPVPLYTEPSIDRKSRDQRLMEAAQSQMTTGRGNVTAMGQAQLNVTAYQTVGMGTGGKTQMGGGPSTNVVGSTGDRRGVVIASKEDGRTDVVKTSDPGTAKIEEKAVEDDSGLDLKYRTPGSEPSTPIVGRRFHGWSARHASDDEIKGPLFGETKGSKEEDKDREDVNIGTEEEGYGGGINFLETGGINYGKGLRTLGAAAQLKDSLKGMSTRNIKRVLKKIEIKLGNLSLPTNIAQALFALVQGAATGGQLGVAALEDVLENLTDGGEIETAMAKNPTSFLEFAKSMASGDQTSEPLQGKGRKMTLQKRPIRGNPIWQTIKDAWNGGHVETREDMQEAVLNMDPDKRQELFDNLSIYSDINKNKSDWGDSNEKETLDFITSRFNLQRTPGKAPSYPSTEETATPAQQATSSPAAQTSTSAQQAIDVNKQRATTTPTVPTPSAQQAIDTNKQQVTSQPASSLVQTGSTTAHKPAIKRKAPPVSPDRTPTSEATMQSTMESANLNHVKEKWTKASQAEDTATKEENRLQAEISAAVKRHAGKTVINKLKKEKRVVTRHRKEAAVTREKAELRVQDLQNDHRAALDTKRRQIEETKAGPEKDKLIQQFWVLYDTYNNTYVREKNDEWSGLLIDADANNQPDPKWEEYVRSVPLSTASSAVSPELPPFTITSSSDSSSSSSSSSSSAASPSGDVHMKEDDDDIEGDVKGKGGVPAGGGGVLPTIPVPMPNAKQATPGVSQESREAAERQGRQGADDLTKKPKPGEVGYEEYEQKRAQQGESGLTNARGSDAKSGEAKINVQIDNAYVPTLRLFFREGDANMVTRINDNPEAKRKDRDGWYSFDAHDWELNDEMDNDLRLQNRVEEARRFYGPLHGDKSIHRKAKDAIAESYNKFQKEIFYFPPSLTPDVSSLRLDVRGGAPLQPLNEDETDATFHDVYMKSWIEIPESSPWKQFTQVQGTQMSDTQIRDPTILHTNDALGDCHENMFIYSTDV